VCHLVGLGVTMRMAGKEIRNNRDFLEVNIASVLNRKPKPAKYSKTNKAWQDEGKRIKNGSINTTSTEKLSKRSIFTRPRNLEQQKLEIVSLDFY
jgi:hypothetical protein